MDSLVKKISKGRRYGTLLLSLQKRLYKRGININPFYLVSERQSETEIPVLKDNPEDYRFEFLASEDMKKIGQTNFIRGQEAQYNDWLKKGWVYL